MRLPSPRNRAAPYRIDVVCLGNICRSPMAGAVLTRRIEGAGLDTRVVTSGIGGWHVGEPMDRRAAALLTAHGYDSTLHRAKQFDNRWCAESDVVLAMDEANLSALRSASGVLDGGAEGGRLRLFRDYDPLAEDGDRAVPDPYYGGDDGFVSVLEMIERTCEEIVSALVRVRVGH